MDRVTLRRPDDWHLHLRDGAMLAAVLPDTAAVMGRGIAMPNLVPPVRTTADAAAYRARILAARPAGSDFVPLMTAYMTDDTDPDDLAALYVRDCTVRFTPVLPLLLPLLLLLLSFVLLLLTLLLRVQVGIEGTNIKAGIIKCAHETGITWDAGLHTFTEAGETTARACARAAKATGLPITTHTQVAERIGLAQIKIFEEEGVDMNRVYIGRERSLPELLGLLASSSPLRVFVVQPPPSTVVT